MGMKDGGKGRRCWRIFRFVPIIGVDELTGDDIVKFLMRTVFNLVWLLLFLIVAYRG